MSLTNASKAQLKFIRSLQQKKIRQQNQCYISEGAKIVDELLSFPHQIHSIFATESWLERKNKILSALNVPYFSISKRDLLSISTLKTPNEVLAIANIKKNKIPDQLQSGPHFILNDVRDPGNMGTIIRTAHWFGIPALFCSPNCVDIYNSKVVQSAMGSIFYQNIYFIEPQLLLDRFPKYQVIASTIDGTNLFTTDVTKQSFIIIGNESHGIDWNQFNRIDKKISIPSFGSAESLNAAVAMAIFCAEMRRREI